ncbi:MAG: formate/nitrite transporter family protein [Firmicutes bacterium]|nr:formate/nitrite transporter family protein [Bacillota bacterium]
MAVRSPAEIAQVVSNAGEKKASMATSVLVVLGLMAGVFIGFGAQVSMTVTQDLSTFAGVGVSKFLSGAIFSVGLMMVIICGAELFTGNSLMLVSLLDGKIRPGGLLRNWLWVYLANFAGSLILAGLVYASGLWKLNNLGLGSSAVNIATAKVNLTFGEAFTRGILCNWLVCLAVWAAYAADDVIGKIAAIFFIITSFVASGFEHSIANMYYIPMGLFLKAAPGIAGAGTGAMGLTWTAFIFKNLLPVTIGNVIGGALFVGVAYWFAYLRPGLSGRMTRPVEGQKGTIES